jgi:Flp pilus assembly protein TadB
MPSLPTIQRLLVISALAWAIFPRWGGFAFGASWVLLLAGSMNRRARAAKLLAANETTLKTLTPEALALARQYPLAYVWPSTAERWGTTWQLSALLALILGGVFAAWALFSMTSWYLVLLAPLVVVLFVGGVMSRRIKIAERVKQDLKSDRPAHDAIVTLLSLKTAVGQWPPEASPDPEPAPELKKS